jgi:hypothetical protein
MKNYFEATEDQALKNLNPRYWAEVEDERIQNESETRHISVPTSRMSFDEEKGLDTQGVVAVTSNGLFARTGADEYGALVYDIDVVSTNAFRKNNIDLEEGYPPTTDIRDIPYETGEKRPNHETMKRNFADVDGNLIDYAHTFQIGLVDAVRDGLYTGDVSLKTPLVKSIMRERIEEDLGISYKEDPIVETTAGLHMLLKNTQRKEGIDTSEDLMKLSALQQTHTRGTQPTPKEAASVYKILAQAETLGLDFSGVHKNAARLGLMATRTDPVQEIEKTHTVAKTR